ncbi:hypothetical protein Droror1_Dr00009443 [Drosera rotundifolia]
MDVNQQHRGLRMRPIITKRTPPPPSSSLDGSGGGGGKEEEKLEEPLSPGARIFHTSKLNCCIIAMFGCETEYNVGVMREGLKQTLIKHPRFSSVLVVDEKNDRKQSWVRTNVNLDDHIIVPEIDPNMDSPDQFVEDYVSDLTTTFIDKSKPLWEFHILNVKTSDANAVAVFKIHHSLGDGISLTSLLLACTRKSSDPEALPTLPMTKKTDPDAKGLRKYLVAIWLALALIWNTIVQSVLFSATMIFLKDSDTPIKGAPGVERTRKRIVRKIISFDDVRTVKSAMNVTVNDVILGITQAGLSRYLNRRYGDEAKAKGEVNEKRDYLPKNIRLRATTLANIRPVAGIQDVALMMEKGSKSRWGNAIGYILIPFHIALQDDPLNCIREAKSAVDKKKLSLEASFSHYGGKLILEKFGPEAASISSYRTIANATMSFSNVAGPVEEVTFYGHPITFVAPTVYGHPQSLTVHFQSYADKMIIVLAADEVHVPDPHQLCDDLVESLQLAKNAVERQRSSEQS